MVIHHFNRLIKNKWVWGVFAVAICAFFVGIDVIPSLLDNRRSRETGFGRLGDESLDPSFFEVLRGDARFGRSEDDSRSQAEINLQAWQDAAALQVAKQLRLEATDEEVRAAILRDRAFQENGSFSKVRYEQILLNNRLTPQGYESFLKRRLSISKLQQVVLGSSTWVSSTELEDAINDWTDKFKVRVAAFQDKDFAKVTVDDKKIEAYYNEHTNSFALPACMKVRFAKFPADDAARLAKFKVDENEMRDHYDSTITRFQTTGTNGVTVTKKFEDVKPVLENELKVIASVHAYCQEIGALVYPDDLKEGDNSKGDLLAKIAAEKNVKVMTSGRFSLEGRFVEGLMVRANSIAPDCEEFLAKVEDLDVTSVYKKYGVVEGTNAVYLVECVPVLVEEKDESGKVIGVMTNSYEEARVPALAEVKDLVRPLALKDAQRTAFKAKVDKSRALALEEIGKGKSFDVLTLAGASVTTSLVFSASSLTPGAFQDAMSVTRTAMKLRKGEISETEILGNSGRRALLVYVEDRSEGDASQAEMFRAQLRDDLSRMAARMMPDEWARFNLERIGYETSDGSSFEE